MVTVFAIIKYIHLYWGKVHPRVLVSCCPLASEKKSKCCLLALLTALWTWLWNFTLLYFWIGGVRIFTTVLHP